MLTVDSDNPLLCRSCLMVQPVEDYLLLTITQSGGKYRKILGDGAMPFEEQPYKAHEDRED